MHLHLRRLVHAQQSKAVEIGLLDAAAVDRDRLVKRGADAVEHRALYLIERTGWIDDLASDVGRHPHLVRRGTPCASTLALATSAK